MMAVAAMLLPTSGFAHDESPPTEQTMLQTIDQSDAVIVLNVAPHADLIYHAFSHQLPGSAQELSALKAYREKPAEARRNRYKCNLSTIYLTKHLPIKHDFTRYNSLFRHEQSQTFLCAYKE